MSNEEERAGKPEDGWSTPPPEEPPLVPLSSTSAPSAAPGGVAIAYPVSWGFSLPSLPGGHGYGPGYHPDRGRETLRGLGRLRLATVIALCASGLTAAVGVLALYLFINPWVAPGILSLPAALGLMLTSFLVQLVAVAFGWSAFEDIADAATGIGPEHVESSRRAVHIIYLAAAAWAIGGLAGLAVFGAYFSSGLGSVPFGSLPREAVLSITVSFALTGIAVNALVAFAMQTLIARLLTERGRNMRRSFYQFALGGTVASVGLSLLCQLVLGSVDLFGLVAVVSAVSLAIYLGQIREAERGTAAMAAFGGRNPDAGAPTSPPPAEAQG